MSPSLVPVHEYEKNVVASPTSAEQPVSPAPTRSKLSARERPVDAVSAHTLVSQPSSLHTSPISLSKPPCVS